MLSDVGVWVSAGSVTPDDVGGFLGDVGNHGTVPIFQLEQKVIFFEVLTVRSTM